MSISVILPTTGRDTLERSIRSALGAEQILVVGDGPTPAARAICSRFPTVEYVETPTFGNCWGQSVHNWVQRSGAAKGSHIVNLDDDDILVPNALDTIRRELAKDPTMVYLFQADLRNVPEVAKIVWSRPWGPFSGDITASNIVAPNTPLLGEWDEGRYDGDFVHISRTVARHSGRVRWVPLVTHVARPRAETGVPCSQNVAEVP